MFTLVLKEKLFSIPRDCRFLKDVKLEIYNSLITNQQYTVKSNVREQIFESFVDNWINNSTPNLSLQNIDEYTVLSEEFDRMKDIIHLFQDKSQNVDLLTIQKEKFQNIYTEKLKLQEENQKIYHQIIELIFHNDRIESDFNYPSFKKRIIKDFEYFDPKEQIRFLNLIIPTKEFEKNGLIYLLDQKEKTAFVFHNKSAESDILIPYSVEHDSTEYIITKILQDSFNGCDTIKTVKFHSNSQLKTIEKNAFERSSIEKISIPNHVTKISKSAFCYCEQLKIIEISENSDLKQIGNYAFTSSAVETITIPSNIVKLKKEWCCGMDFTTKIEIKPNNNRFLYYDNKYLIAKSNLNDTEKVYDVLLFANRDIETAIIPPFVKRVASYSLGCPNLTKVEFSEDSQIQVIESSAFYESKIEELQIPSSVVEFETEWCCLLKDLKNIKIIQKEKQNFIYFDNNFILGKSNQKSDIFDILVFARRDIVNAIIPSFIKQIGPYSFTYCHKLKKVTFSKDSQLRIIDDRAFSFSSLNEIEIPSKVKIIGEGAFHYCNSLQKVDFDANSEVMTIKKMAFGITDIKRISIPKEVYSICNSAFMNCNKLKFVDISNNSKLSLIGNYAFINTNLNDLFIPASVSNIKFNIFTRCPDLKIIEIDENSNLKSLNTNNIKLKVIIMVPVKVSQHNTFK